MRRFSREEILERLKAKINKRQPIIAGDAGLGIIGKMQEAAGIDLIMACGTGPFRMDGIPSFVGHMAYGNCNRITLDLVDILVNRLTDTPVIAGVGAGDPFTDISYQMETLCYHGASGITNVPTLGGKKKGVLLGLVRADIEANGFGFEREVHMIRCCRERDIFSAAYAFEEEQVRMLVQAGADMIVLHVGETDGGPDGFETITVSEAAEKIQTMYMAAVKENPDIIVLCHGCPPNDTESVEECMRLTSVHGFIGASVMDKIPVEKELASVVHAFKATRLR